MSAVIGEDIAVEVLFRNREVYPRCFWWNGNKFTTDKIILRYKAKNTNIPLLYYSLQGETAAYLISWDTRTNAWKLEEIMDQFFD
jgi:hypothetical protein